MSCHTWAYRQIKPEEESNLRETIKKDLMADYRYVPDGSTEAEVIDRLYEKINPIDDRITREYITKSVRTNNPKIQKAIKEVYTCSIKELGEIYRILLGSAQYKFYDGNCYVECGFDEPVRIYGYPEDKFTDADKFIDWIKESEAEYGYPISEIYVKKGYYDEEELSRGFSDVMADRIHEFWKHYDNKVLVEFG